MLYDGNMMVIFTINIPHMMFGTWEEKTWLVLGEKTPLKNDGVRQLG